MLAILLTGIQPGFERAGEHRVRRHAHLQRCGRVGEASARLLRLARRAACALLARRPPPSAVVARAPVGCPERRLRSHRIARWYQTSFSLNVCVCEGDVNEFPRESLPKLFSYAVAALSNFFGPRSGTHESSPLVCSRRLYCRTVAEAGVRVR